MMKIASAERCLSLKPELRPGHFILGGLGLMILSCLLGYVGITSLTGLNLFVTKLIASTPGIQLNVAKYVDDLTGLVICIVALAAGLFFTGWAFVSTGLKAKA